MVLIYPGLRYSGSNYINYYTCLEFGWATILGSLGSPHNALHSSSIRSRYIAVLALLGHSNWIISFLLTACIPTLHPHAIIISRYLMRNFCNLYAKMSALRTKSELLAMFLYDFYCKFNY